MHEQGNSEHVPTDSLHNAIQALLQENLSDHDLRHRLRTLLETSENEATTGQPTTDDATDHPGYQ
jgi:hypothetical protein